MISPNFFNLIKKENLKKIILNGLHLFIFFFLLDTLQKKLVSYNKIWNK